MSPFAEMAADPLSTQGTLQCGAGSFAATREYASLPAMKPRAAAILCVIVVGGGLAPAVAGCSDEKSGAPPTSPTSVAGKQTFSSGDGGSSAGSSSGSIGSPGGW